METKLPKSIVRRRFLARVFRVMSAGVAAGILLLLACPRGVDHLKLATPSGRIWVKAGNGTLAVFLSNEPEPWNLKWRPAWNPNERVSTAMFFWPQTVVLDRLGLNYVTGTYYTTPFSGWAVAISYWYGIGLALLVFLLSDLFALPTRSSRPPSALDPELETGVPTPGGSAPDVALDPP